MEVLFWCVVLMVRVCSSCVCVFWLLWRFVFVSSLSEVFRLSC